MTQRLGGRFLSEILDDLEGLELPLLAWGVTTGSLSVDEVMSTIRDHLATATAPADTTADEVHDALLDAALLFQVPNTTPVRYRTRMGETVRLTARLRQLFALRQPASPPSRWWERGRTLVADYRLHTARRRYPKRDVTIDAALAALAQEPLWTSHDSVVARAQLSHPTLAQFQVDATRTILNATRTGRSAGVIIGAGTGSGKTLGFYLPALCAMATRARQGGGGVHSVALYPRIELLRDQLRGAISTTMRVNTAQEQAQARRLRLGVLYGDTPQSVDQLNSGKAPHLVRAWPERDEGLVCPYLTCPACGAELVWPAQDRSGESRERLRCVQRSCDMVITDLALTRESLHASPPDLLFTTTEMLNRNSTHATLGPLLGWLGTNRPSLVLLDEAHTYSGMHGAQVALLLRRWRNALRRPVTFVGLSATLRDAAAFFGQLTGLPDAAVDYVTPRDEELEEEGREYAIALRSDPVSGVSQLSTSIQAAMLFGRVLDPLNREFLYGSRGFLFTDDLDVTNRFYDDLRDAEGSQDRRGNRMPGRVLAGLRSPDGPFRSERYIDGQSWDLVQQIGHDLDPMANVGELRIGRTSSQDVGVDKDADLVVATASLEVGYDDERVGLVLQHKAPHDAAAFLQRRGRAGRRRGTRPWTVVTLSDYGRDRLAYQAYDSLFSPELAATRLPIGNRFVLKIHGTQAMLDWLAGMLRAMRIDPRRLLTAPTPAAQPIPAQYVDALTELLEKVIVDAALQDDLINHLRRALDITTDEAQALLWEQPRSLLLSVAPTALRRLRCSWQPVDTDPGAHPRSMLPDFLTRTLYEPLNVPEVTFELPFASDPESLPIERALREAVPGRVSRRYGHRRSDDRTWIDLPQANAQGMLDITTFVETHTPQGIWTPPGQQPIQVLRPHVIKLQRPDATVDDRSQGIPLWASQVVAPASGLYEANVPKPSTWGDRVTAVGFATSAAGNPAEIRRMTLGADCETVYTRPTRTIASTVRYTFDGQPAALGFRLTADAARFRILPLDLTREAVTTYLRSPQWRLLAFTAAVAQDPALDGVANTFQRGWLTLVYTAAHALAATEPGNSASNSETLYSALRGGAWRDDIEEVLRILYRDATPAGAPAPERLVTTLTGLSNDASVIACLDRHGRLLWSEDVVTNTGQLAQKVYRETVAAAILAAAQRACPDAQDRDLIVDAQEPSDANGPADIWLSETALGGLGIIEQLVSYYARDPRRFWGLVDSALGPSDHEYVHDSLVRLLDHVVSDPAAAAGVAIQALRQARSAHDADQALQQLRSAWTTLDGYPRHPAIAALSVRLLRPGSTSNTDATALGLVRVWDDLQQRLGIEVDATTLAYLVGIGRLAVPGTDGTPLSADQVFSLLWPRGSRARVQHLQHYQPYAGPPLLDRLLVQAAHDERLLAIDVTDPTWLDRYTAEMRMRGTVVLVAPVASAREFGRALQMIPAVAIDRDVLRVYGEVATVVRQDGSLRAMIEIREAAQ